MQKKSSQKLFGFLTAHFNIFMAFPIDSNARHQLRIQMNPEKYRFVCLWRYILSGLSRYFVQNVNFVRFLQFFDIILVATPLYTKNHLVVDTKWIQFESTRHCMTPYINYVSGILLYFLVIANILNCCVYNHCFITHGIV